MSDSEETSSESDSFYDAQDSPNPGEGVRKGGTLVPQNRQDSTSRPQLQPTISVTPGSPPSQESITDLNTSRDNEELEILTGDQLAIRDRRWSRLEKLRRREEAERQGGGCDGIGVDGGEEDNHADSTESSVEGIYVQGVRSSHPFQVVESDTRSNNSGPNSVSARSGSQSVEPSARIRLSLDEPPASDESRSRETSVGPDLRHEVSSNDSNGGEDVMDAPSPQSSSTRLPPPHNLPNLVPDIVSSSTTKPNTPSNLINHSSSISSSIIVKEESPLSSSPMHANVPAKNLKFGDSYVEELHYYYSTSDGAGCPPPDSLNLEDVQPAAPPRRKKRAARTSASDSADTSPLETDVPLLGSSKVDECLSTASALPSSSSARDRGGPIITVGSGVITSSPLRNSIRSREGREIGRVLTCGSGNEREIGRVFTASERAAAQHAASSLLSPNSHLDAASYSNIDAMSGLNINLACRGEFVVKPQDDERNRQVRSDDRLENLIEVSQDPCGAPPQPQLPPIPQQPQSFSRLSSKSKSPTTDERPDSDGNVSRSSARGHRYSSSAGAGGLSSQRSAAEGGGYVSGGGGSGGYHSGGSGGQHASGSGGSRPASGRGSGGSDRRSMAGSIGSAGSDGIIKQLGMFVRTKSDSGKKLTDTEILQQIKVKNLDTGMEMDLATAEEALPPTINPLSLHIMRLTSEYSGTLSNPSTFTEATSFDSDTESVISSVSDFPMGQVKGKTTFNRLFTDLTKGANKVAKQLSSEISKRHKTREEKEEEKRKKLETNISTTDGVQVSRKDAELAEAQNFKRIQAHKSGPYDFENIQFGQDLSGHHSGPIWCMKFSLCGRLLATAGQDCILRIWVLRDRYNYFNNMRQRYQAEHEGITEAQVVQDEITQSYLNSPDSRGHIFMDRPFLTYTGHTSDLLDISWSNNFFILTSSMDKTVRLWHISRKECLCVFQHIDFVTAIGFHPRNDKFFISGSLDGKIRLWNIPDKKVALWTEVDGPSKLITAANFCSNGKFAVVGTYDGRCIFYNTDQLKYYTTIDVRSTRGKNSRGRKVTGIEPMPGEDKILVTSTDSRIRLYDLRDLSLICKYRGYANLSSQIRAAFSPDGRYITAGSENHCVFLWSTVHIPSSLTARKDRNNSYEAIKAHNAAVTCTLFAPVPELIFEAVERGREAAGKAREDSAVSSPSMSSKSGCVDILGDKEPLSGYVVISGDYDGDIKVFIKEGKKNTSLPR